MEIIIVGAGIAGLGAGIALRRAGHKVTILEQSSLLHETGAAISIAPNASRILHSWDFDPARSKMTVLSTAGIFTGDTMETVVPDFFSHIEEKYGIPLRAVHRVDLHNQLRLLAIRDEGPGHPVDIQVRAKVVDYVAAQGKVILADNSSLQADLVIAADGVHSAATTHVLGEEEISAGHTGWGAMRWLVPTDELASDPETSSMLKKSTLRYYVGASGKGDLVWYPCRNDEVQNFVYLTKSVDSSNAKEDFRATIDANTLRNYAEKDFCPALQAVIRWVFCAGLMLHQKAAKSGVRKAKDIKFWNLIAREPISRWHKDRLLLIGDAAHPMLPFQAQGGNQAIEDGGALGVLFDRVHDKASIEVRLTLFEEIRRNRGSSVQILSHSSNPVPQSIRDAASKYLPDGRRLENMNDASDFMYSFDVIKECQAILAR